jgi:hypothetical protein
MASVRLLRLGFGTDLARILQGAWLMLRAVQSWAPFPDNDPDGAQARMRELYGLVRLRFGQPADPARAARLEIDWWRAHRRRQYASHPAETGDELVESLTRLYCYLFGETEAVVRPVCRDAVRKRVRPADSLMFRGDVAVVQVGMVTALAADELIRIGVAAFRLTFRDADGLASQDGCPPRRGLIRRPHGCLLLREAGPPRPDRRSREYGLRRCGPGRRRARAPHGRQASPGRAARSRRLAR